MLKPGKTKHAPSNSSRVSSIDGGFFMWFKVSWLRNDLRFSSSVLSGVVSPSGHQSWEYALKSPVKNVAKGVSALILEYKLS